MVDKNKIYSIKMVDKNKIYSINNLKELSIDISTCLSTIDNWLVFLKTELVLNNYSQSPIALNFLEDQFNLLKELLTDDMKSEEGSGYPKECGCVLGVRVECVEHCGGHGTPKEEKIVLGTNK